VHEAYEPNAVIGCIHAGFLSRGATQFLSARLTTKVSRNFERISAFQPLGQTFTGQTMDRKAEEASEGRRKTVVILSERSREIIRLFEWRQRKRQQVEQDRQLAFVLASSERELTKPTSKDSARMPA
jgi:hypothetical protein